MFVWGKLKFVDTDPTGKCYVCEKDTSTICSKCGARVCAQICKSELKHVEVCKRNLLVSFRRQITVFHGDFSFDLINFVDLQVSAESQVRGRTY